jgi:hypothetical protein
LTSIIADRATGRAIEGAQVSIPARRLVSFSDSIGRASFRDLESGIVRITVTRSGYAQKTATVLIGLSDSIAVVLLIDAGGQQLDTVTVTAPMPKAYLREFDVRRAQGLGRFLTEAQLDSASHERLADFLARRFPGVRAEWDRLHLSVQFGRAGFYSLSGKTCRVQTYIDDMPAQPGDIASLLSTDVAGVEYHSNAPPVQYRTAGSQCGVILVWTKR